MQPHYFQSLVDVDAPADIADRLGEVVIEVLVALGIVGSDTAACVPGGGAGRPPGPRWQEAIVEIDESFLTHPCNGVEVVCGRAVHDAGDWQPVPHCPACHAPNPAASGWRDSLARWKGGDEAASLLCAHCGERSPVTAWRHNPPIGLGSLAIRFWNWPSLNREFIDRIADVLGHRLVLVEGRQNRL